MDFPKVSPGSGIWGRIGESIETKWEERFEICFCALCDCYCRDLISDGGLGAGLCPHPNLGFFLIFPYLLSLFFSCVGKVPPAAKSRSATREATHIPSLPQ